MSCRDDRLNDADGQGSGFLPVCVGLALAVLLPLLAFAVFDSQPTAQEPEVEQIELAVVYDAPAEDASGTGPARTDGPIYDPPDGVGQTIACDRLNREHLLLTTPEGGAFLLPWLDEDGEQEVMPRP